MERTEQRLLLAPGTKPSGGDVCQLTGLIGDTVGCLADVRVGRFLPVVGSSGSGSDRERLPEASSKEGVG